ncbi:MAG: polyprenyl diphosphate synthase [Dehalococcoidales bacterium]
MKKDVNLPNHIAIIIDGNRRWAKQHGLPSFEGHRAAVKNLRSVLKYLSEQQIKYVTLYLFSTENWKRSAAEVKGLFQLLEEMLDKEITELNKRGVRLRHLGRLNELPHHLQVAITRAVELTKNNTDTTLSLAVNYGGRTEILDTVRRLITDGISPQNVDEELFSSYLYTAGLPDVDLLIRTGGELRTSNFLTWQTVYTEFYFSNVLWPDFDKKEVDKALLSYSQRQRRFGGS